jgi:hypothetical protein
MFLHIQGLYLPLVLLLVSKPFHISLQEVVLPLQFPKLFLALVQVIM